MGIYRVGQKVKCRMDGKIYSGVVEEAHDNYIVVFIAETDHHCWFGKGTISVFADYD